MSMRDVLGFGVFEGDVIAVIERYGNNAKYVFGTLVEYEESDATFRMKYPDDKISKWRQQYFHGIRRPEYNKVLLVKTREEVMTSLAESIQRGLDQSARGETVDLGDFTQYLEDDDERDS